MLPNIKRYESVVHAPDTIGDVDKLGDILKNNTPNTKYFQEEQPIFVVQQPRPVGRPKKTNYGYKVSLRLTQGQVEKINALSNKTYISPSKIVRDAIDFYLAHKEEVLHPQ